MLYMAAKTFDISEDVTVQAGKDIVDVSSWDPHRVKLLVDHRFLAKTDATKPTVNAKSSKADSPAKVTPATENPPGARRRVSPLARRERVFKTRLAKQGDK